MARFCTQCGSPVAEELSFCLNCGTKVAAPPPPPPASQPVAAAPAPPAAVSPAVPAAAPAKKGSPVVKIILVIVAFLILIMVASIGTCVYIGYRAKRAVEGIKQGESSIKIPTSQGEIKIGGGATEKGGAVAGVPVYPGATALEGGGQFSFGDKFQIGGQDYETSDSVDQVVDFYKEKLGSKLSMAENAGHYRLSVETGDEQHAGVVTIDVFADEQSGKTKITIAHLGGMK